MGIAAKDRRRAGGQGPISTTIRHLMRRSFGMLELIRAREGRRHLKSAPPSTVLRDLVANAAHISDIAAQPFVNARWGSESRIARMVEHCSIVDEINHPFNIRLNEYCEIIRFDLDEYTCRLTIDRPLWLMCDGLLTTTLWVGIDRAFNISFTLSDFEGIRTAYVGGIQGRRDDSSLDLYRRLTKATHGVRPSDFTFELLRMILKHLGVQQIKCVANDSRYQKTRRARMTIRADDQVFLDYDEIWRGRGGVEGPDGFFVVSPRRQERAIEEIPSRKRSMYRQRYQLLERLESEVAAALRTPLPVSTHGVSAPTT